MKLKFTILGCGSSMGVPRADGYWGKCNPKEKKNFRTRCSALISSLNKNILIDTSPDLRSQLLKNKIKRINDVIYTHYHADQTHGINDLRIFYLTQKKKINIYADVITYKYLKNNFTYCFEGIKGYPATLDLKKINKKIIIKDNNFNININSIKIRHGYIDALGYIINKKCAYISDVNEIYKKDYKNLLNLKFLIIDCLKENYHPSHYNLSSILEIVKIIKPTKTILTNLHTDLDYNYLKKILPKNITPAYDGMYFYF